MKNIYPLFLVLGIITSLSSCLKDACEVTRTFHIWNAIYVQADEFRVPIVTESAKALENPGKIYFYKNYVLVNELREGVHIIDNSNPENPQNIAFIKIPGNVDIAVKENILYADNYADLLSIDLSNPTDPQMVSRCENVFPLEGFVQGLGYLSHFEETTEVVEVDCDDPNVGQQWWWFDGFNRAAAESGFVLDAANFGSATGSGGANTGVGGSLARFAATGDYLYSVSNFDLKVFGLNDLTKPDLINTVNIGWGIETIFPYGENLFIGANDGMYIFDNSDPENPRRLSKFQHARACDPVYVDGNIAYVTLRNGTQCENFNNQLDVVDVSRLTAPKLLATHEMHNPHGLSVADGHVFICENDEGLKVFDASDVDQIGSSLTAHIKGFRTYDIITLPNKVALVIGGDGLYQFDYSDPSNLRQLSVIPVN